MPVQLDPIDRAALRSELRRWGAWMDRREEFSGYPSQDNVSRFHDGRGGGPQGHRVLCRDMPDDVWMIHRRYLCLPWDLSVVVWGTYVGVMAEDGKLKSFELRCQEMGLNEKTARRRLERAYLHMSLLQVSGIRATHETL